MISNNILSLKIKWRKRFETTEVEEEEEREVGGESNSHLQSCCLAHAVLFGVPPLESAVLISAAGSAWMSGNRWRVKKKRRNQGDG